MQTFRNRMFNIAEGSVVNPGNLRFEVERYKNDKGRSTFYPFAASPVEISSQEKLNELVTGIELPKSKTTLGKGGRKFSEILTCIKASLSSYSACYKRLLKDNPDDQGGKVTL